MLTLLGALVVAHSGIPGNFSMAAQDGVSVPSTVLAQEDQDGLPTNVFDELYRTGILDCNGNGIADDWEYAFNGQLDENENGILDVCESPAVGVGGVPPHGRLDGPAPLLIQRTEAGTYLFSLRVSNRDVPHDARIDIVDPAGQLCSTILERAISLDTTVAWRPPNRWPDGSLFQRDFYDIVATFGKNSCRASVFLESQK